MRPLDVIEPSPAIVAKYEKKGAASKASDGAAFILEGNPDAETSLPREELNERLERPAWSGYKVFADGTVKIKQRQDNVQFAAMVESVDESVGRVVKTLQKLKLEDNTLVIFTSDNGGFLYCFCGIIVFEVLTHKPIASFYQESAE